MNKNLIRKAMRGYLLSEDEKCELDSLYQEDSDRLLKQCKPYIKYMRFRELGNEEVLDLHNPLRKQLLKMNSENNDSF